MRLKRLTAAAAALVIAVCCAVSAYAEPEPLEPAETGDIVTTAAQPAGTTAEAEVTEPTVTQAPQQTTASETVTAAQTTPQQVSPDPAQTTAATTAATTPTTTETTVGRKIEPTKVYLTIGEIKDEEFDVTLNIVPDQLITTAVIKIEYDSSLMELTGSIINSADIGGQPTEENKDGVYTFTYINTKGTQYSGVYSTMRFKITDKKMTESVIYVSVEKLEDNDLLDVPNNIQNGIVKYQEEVPEDDSSKAEEESKKEDDSSKELPVLNVKLGTLPMMLDELEIPDAKNVKSVKILDPSLAVYEQSALTLLKSGETEMVVKYNSGKELRFKLKIAEADKPASLPDVTSQAEEKTDTSGRTFMIAMAILAAIAAIAIEYILIMKPFGRKNADEEDDEDEVEYEEYDEDDDTEMVQDPEEVFARKKRPDKRPDK